MKDIFRLSLGASLFLAAANLTSLSAAQSDDPESLDIIAHRTKPHATDAPTTGSTSASSPIKYHGGAVMGAPHVYVIWYGNWNQNNGTDTAAGKQIVIDFLNGIGGSPYFNINKSYSTTATNITGAVSYLGSVIDQYSQGSKLSDSKVWAVVQHAITTGVLPRDTNGVYFVLTSSDVSETSGFCNRYCGWHTHGNSSGTDIKYSFVGNAARCLSGCATQSTSPNGNAGVDGMVSVIAHELEEATSDPDLNAWYDSGGAENADKCAWTFGSSQYKVANGSYANMHIGTRDYLIQRNLYHGAAGDYCATAVDGSGNLTK